MTPVGKAYLVYRHAGTVTKEPEDPEVPALSTWVSAILALPLMVQGPSGAKHLLKPEAGSSGESSGG